MQAVLLIAFDVWLVCLIALLPYPSGFGVLTSQVPRSFNS